MVEHSPQTLASEEKATTKTTTKTTTTKVQLQKENSKKKKKVFCRKCPLFMFSVCHGCIGVCISPLSFFQHLRLD